MTLPSLDPLALEAVTGGKATAATSNTTHGLGSLASSTSDLASQLKSITSSLNDINNVKKSSGFDNNTMLMLAFMVTQNRAPSNNVVLVHRGWW